MTHRGVSRFILVVALIMIVLFFLALFFALPMMISALLLPYSFEGKVIMGYLFFGWCLSGFISFYWIIWLGYDSFQHVDLITSGTIWALYGAGLVIPLIGRSPLSTWIFGLILMIPGLLAVIAGALIWKPEKPAK